MVILLRIMSLCFLTVYGFVVVSCPIKPLKVTETSDIAQFTAITQLSMVSFSVLPVITLCCPLPPLAGWMPVSYLRDGDQAKPSTAVTLPITRALLVDIFTISMGFYGYLLYFKCMFA